MLHDTSVAPTRSSARDPGLRVVAVLDPEPVDEQAGLLGRRLLLVRRRRRDRAGAQAGDGGDDLEDGARHVPAQRRARQERLRRVVEERREGRLRRRRVGDGRRVVGRRRGERQDLAGPRVEHDDRAPVRPSARTAARWRSSDSDRVRSCGSYGSGRTCEGRPWRVAGQPGELRVVAPLEPGPAVAARGVADDLADRVVRVDPVELAVGVVRVVREHLAVAVEDPAARHGPGCRDDRRVGRGARELRAAHDPPVAGRAGERAEGEREDDRDVHDRPAEGMAASRRSVRVTRRRPGTRRRQPWRDVGGGGGSTPLSDSASRSPMTTAFASSDEPP